MKYIKYNSYTFGHEGLTEEDLPKIVGKLEEVESEASGVLTGRASVAKVELPEIGPVIIKSYKRGGLLRHLNRATYMRLGVSRCESEYNYLVTAAKYGVNVPKPVAFVRRGFLFCRYWLALEEIENCESLTQISTDDPNRTKDLMLILMEQVKKLMDQSIYHVDLHPGNILVDRNDKVYIIDFDKAHMTKLSYNDLLVKYTQRWVRAVKKYNLPDVLIEKFRISQ